MLDSTRGRAGSTMHREGYPYRTGHDFPWDDPLTPSGPYGLERGASSFRRFNTLLHYFGRLGGSSGGFDVGASRLSMHAGVRGREENSLSGARLMELVSVRPKGDRDVLHTPCAVGA